MSNVEVKLRAGFLARYVALTVVAATSTTWEIQASDTGGARYGVTVDGEPTPRFASQEAAQAFLDSLGTTRVWATGDRIPTSYVQHANDGRGFNILASA